MNPETKQLCGPYRKGNCWICKTPCDPDRYSHDDCALNRWIEINPKKEKEE